MTAAFPLDPKKVRITSNFEITDSLQEYATKKLSKPLDTFGNLLTEDVQLNLKADTRALHDTEHKGRSWFTAEVTAFCRDKRVIKDKEEGEDMYALIDKMEDTLMRSMRKLKEKRVGGKRKGTSDSDSDMDDETMDDIDDMDYETMDDIE